MIRQRPKSSKTRRKRRNTTHYSHQSMNRQRPFSSHVYQTKRTTTICSRSTSDVHQTSTDSSVELFSPSPSFMSRKKKRKKKNTSNGKNGNQSVRKKRRRAHPLRYHRQHRSLQDQKNTKLEKLRKENDHLLKQIDQYTEEKVQNFNSIKNKMNDLNDLADEFVHKIEEEKRDLHRLEKININLEKRIQEQKRLRNQHILASRKSERSFHPTTKKIVSIHDQRISGKNKIVQIEKQISILESKLDLNQKKLNIELSKNTEIQESIRKLRHEKQNFNKIYKKIERELIQKQNEIARTIEDSNLEYEERETILREIHRIKQVKNTKKYEYQYKLKELDRIIKKDNLILRKLKENFSHKKEQGKEHKKLKNKVINTRWNLMESRAQKFVTKEKIDRLKQMFARIEMETEMKIDVLIEKLSESSEIHFGLFDYINKLNQENEKLEKINQNIRSRILEQEKKNEKENQSKIRLTQLQKKISVIEEEIREYESKIGFLKEEVIQKVIIEEKLVPILKLFCIIPESTEVENININEKNLIMYAGRIEEQLNLLITFLGQPKKKKNKKKQKEEEKTKKIKKKLRFLLPPKRKKKEEEEKQELEEELEEEEEEKDGNITPVLFIGPSSEKVSVDTRKKHMQNRIKKELGDVFWGSFSRRNLFQQEIKKNNNNNTTTTTNINRSRKISSDDDNQKQKQQQQEKQEEEEEKKEKKKKKDFVEKFRHRIIGPSSFLSSPSPKKPKSIKKKRKRRKNLVKQKKKRKKKNGVFDNIKKKKNKK